MDFHLGIMMPFVLLLLCPQWFDILIAPEYSWIVQENF